MIELTGYTDKHEYTNKHGVKSVVYLMDCMDAMAQMGKKEFSLAVVDPPYDFSCSKTSYVNKNILFSSRFQRKGIGQKDKGGLVIGGNYPNTLSEPPKQTYFDSLIKVSKNQIIWGAQTFARMLPHSMQWVFFDKRNGGSKFADGELAWTSFGGSVRLFRPDYMKAEIKCHPTQKPIALYDWIFHNYAKPNDTILDTHLGSGSSRIAADKHNLPFTGIELDPDYFRDHCRRFDRYTSQLTLF